MNELKTLIVEDESLVGLELKHRLELMGFEVCGMAATANKAIQIIEEKKPNLVLMDVKIKGELSGIETAKIIREKYSIPSIFITAFSDDKTLEQIAETGNLFCLRKPLDSNELKEAIQHYISFQ
jgi:response regulator of citrate/malate metabolism